MGGEATRQKKGRQWGAWVCDSKERRAHGAALGLSRAPGPGIKKSSVAGSPSWTATCATA